MFPDLNNGAAFVPEFKTSLVGSGEWPGFLLVGIKKIEKNQKKISHPSVPRLKYT
jgi:hypothetical protein